MKLNFQTVFLAVLGIGIIAAIAIFASNSGGSSNSAKAAKLTIWGDVEPSLGLYNSISSFNDSHSDTFSLDYAYHKPEQITQDFIESLANGTPPDLLLIDSTHIYRIAGKLAEIPYASLPLATYQATFVDSAQVFLSRTGALALPMVDDPVVLYWNKDLFSNASIANPPKYWDELLTMEPKLTVRSAAGSGFDSSAIALGGFDNITHAKDVLATMLLQTGIPIASRDPESGHLLVSLDSTTRSTGERPVDSALRFYTDFANPDKTLYSWNRTLPNSIDQFLAGKLAMYIGFASDYRIISAKNPHLNFSVAQVPQMRDASAQATGGKLEAMGIVKAGRQAGSSLAAATALLNDPQFLTSWSQQGLVAPARRDLLGKSPSDPVLPTFFTAALRARTWLDPNPEGTDTVFRDTIDGLISGRFQTPSDASGYLTGELSSVASKASAQ